MDDSRLDKIRKLLAQAEDPSVTPQEAEAFTAKAADLIAKYGIDAAMLALKEPNRDEVIDKKLDLDPPFALSKATLLFAIAEPLRCKAIRVRERCHDGKNRYTYQMHLFGYRSDVERCEVLYTSLLLQAANGMQHTPVPPGRDKGAFRESWLEGFAWAIGSRLATAEQKAADDAESSGTPGVALVLADRSVVVDRVASEAYPSLKKAKPRKLVGGGEGHGWDAGQKADVGGTRIGGRKVAALR